MKANSAWPEAQGFGSETQVRSKVGMFDATSIPRARLFTFPDLRSQHEEVKDHAYQRHAQARERNPRWDGLAGLDG